MTLKRSKNSVSRKRWSADVTHNSHALDLEKNIFTLKDPRTIAISLKKSAEQSAVRKTTPYASAMSMLNFYLNRAGKNLDAGQKIILGQTKKELRHIFRKD